MKWNNCSQEEAQEAYDSLKSKYKASAEEYLQSKKQYSACYSEYKTYSQKMEPSRSEKLSFERRIEQIQDIIRMLEQDGSVDSMIGLTNSFMAVTDAVFKRSLLCSGIAAPKIAERFRCPRVEEVSGSQQALDELKKEKARLEQALTELNSKINAMEQEVAALTSKMNSLIQTQTSLSKTMKNCTYEMNHYKKYL